MLPFYLGVASSVLVEWYQTGDMSKATYLANFIIRTLASVKKRKDLITLFVVPRWTVRHWGNGQAPVRPKKNLLTWVIARPHL
ncbi:MAG: hypothetical protein CBE00_01820 [Planctomycetaceae bacterium TMED240]|nr:hypothetical protein [Rhodopirellula sp.]OUX08376.1 MAG: hypothetical protein CBE00_01820 [Planctomycetaceae bacterium TMED240]